MIKITCDVCGQEYTPAEIFNPSVFFGNPKEIIRNSAGKIEFVTGSDMDLEEEYICDNCNNKMHIKANINFIVNEKEEEFNEEFVTSFNRQPKIELKEEVSLF